MLTASVATAGAMLSRASSAGIGRGLDFANDGLTKSDIAILRFLATIELIECDIWQQYEELGGLTEGPQNSYQLALQFLDHNSSRQISDNCICEVSHATFLNEFLKSEGAEPVDLNRFHILSGSSVAGARDVGRLTNLMHLNLDTGWHIRYRREDTRELDSPIPREMRLVNRPSIPRSEEDLSEAEHIPSNRQHRSIPLWLRRTQCFQPVFEPLSERNARQSLENCAGDRRSGDSAISGMD
jgi:hypothetical protein